jgi:3-oxoacyl-[acyl-carrier protein] reductase
MSDAAAQITVDLSGQVALVTGASRGLGRAIARTLARCGARVACVARDEAKLAETAEAIRAAGGSADTFACDVKSGEAVQGLVERIADSLGGLQILVNNAGITRDTLLPRMSDEQWDEVILTNLRGTFLFTRAVARPMMQGRYGRIINLASVSGMVGNAGQSNYSASKAGIIGFTRTVARELASRGVTVNAVAPGFIETEMTAVLGPAIREEVQKRIPLKRLGAAPDVAEAVAFLASKASGYITGQTLVIDGGMTC